MKTKTDVTAREKEDLQNYNNELFLKEARKACVKRGMVYSFKCPFCKGTARAGKETRTGLILARCKACGIDVKE